MFGVDSVRARGVLVRRRRHGDVRRVDSVAGAHDGARAQLRGAGAAAARAAPALPAHARRAAAAPPPATRATPARR